MRHILGNKVLQYDVDDRGVIVDEREIDRTINLNPDIPDVSIWIKQHMVFWYDMSKPADVYTQNFNDWQNYNPNSVSITNNKIVVNGLIDNFRIASIGKETESFSVFIEGLGDKNLVYRVKLDENNTISPIYFSVNQHNGYFANLAFYNSIGFDSVPTKQNDGFTEQDLIDYVLENLITK